MNSKDGIKLGIALAIIALAVGLFIFRTRSAAEAGDDSKTYWYCEKSQKGFEIAGEDYDRSVRTGRKAEVPSADGSPGRARIADVVVTQAKSPYTGEWTGVPASKCGDCSEVFPLRTDARGDNLCPKCNWNPATGSKGPTGGPSGAEKPE